MNRLTEPAVEAPVRALSTLCLLLLLDCATVPPAPPVSAPLPAKAPLEALPLPPGLASCVRHSDCLLADEPIRVVENAEDCQRPLPPQIAVNAARARPLFDAARRCVSRGPFGPPPAYRVVVPTAHAACVERECAVRPGGALTRDEQAEESRGEGSVNVVDAGCYLDSDCRVEGGYTQFPSGPTNARGEELCPVCERPGERLPDESARVARLSGSRTVSTLKVDDQQERPVDPEARSLTLCPALQCRPRSPVCERRTCRTEVPPRGSRTPLAVVRFALAPEPEAPPPPPDLPPLPQGDTVSCSSSTECVVQVGCCGAEAVLNQRTAAVRARGPQLHCNAPCAREGDDMPPRPSLKPTCFQSVCLSTEQRAEFLESQRLRRAFTPAWNAYLVAHRRWEKQVSAVEADLERSSERE